MHEAIDDLEPVAEEPVGDGGKINFIPEDPVTRDLLAKVLAQMYKHGLESLESASEDNEQDEDTQEQDEEQPTVKATIRSKAGRLVLLMRLRGAGVLEGQTLQAIGDVLGVERSTIMRDLRVLDQVEEEYQQLMALQPWVRRYYTVTEFAQEIGASPETARCMVRDGLVEAHKQRGRWRIPVAEVDRFKRSKR